MKYTVKQIMMLARRVRLNLNVYYLINWAKSLHELYQVLNPITTSSKKVSFLPFLPSLKEFSTFSTFSNFVVYSDHQIPGKLKCYYRATKSSDDCKSIKYSVIWQA